MLNDELRSAAQSNAKKQNGAKTQASPRRATRDKSWFLIVEPASDSGTMRQIAESRKTVRNSE